VTQSTSPSDHSFRTFLIVWGGQLVSTLGSGLSGFAVGVWLYDTTGSTTLFALSLLVYILPSIIFSPISGMVSDRYDRRRVMIFADSLAAVGTAFAFVMLLTGHLQVWHIYLSGFLSSTANTFQWPAWSAATATLVPKEHLGRSGGLNRAGEAISNLLTPAAAGALYVTSGLKAIFILDLVSFAAALITLVAVRFPPPERSAESPEAHESWIREALFGWRYIGARPGLLGLLITFAVMNFFANMTFPLLTPMLLNVTTPDTYGIVVSIGGAGMLLGTLVMSAWGGFKRKIFSLFLGDTVAALAGTLIGLTTGIWWIAAFNFVWLGMFPISQGSSDAIWQRKVAQDVQGRVFAARRMMAFSIIPISYVLAGPLAEQVFEPLLLPGGPLASTLIGQIVGVGVGRGTGLLFALANLGTALVALAMVLHPRIRRMELELPDAVPNEAEEGTGTESSTALADALAQ